MSEIDFVGLVGSFCNTFFKETEFLSQSFRSKSPTSALTQFIIAFYRVFFGWKI